MLATPEINFRRTPVTLILTAVALALEVVCTLKPEMRMSYYNEFKLGIWWQIWTGELWRPFTTTVMHGGLLHAVFNMYWMTVFGPVVEHHFGSYRALGLIVLFAYVSSLAQFLLPFYIPSLLGAEQGPMVGLSGVLYGLFGICWMGSRHRTEYQLVCDPMTVQILLGWLLICIPLTYLGPLNVGNLAHVSGLLIGVIVGQAIFDVRRRAQWTALATAIALLALASLVLPTFYVGLRP
jgi:membrane associated rhomboid family serine protease